MRRCKNNILNHLKMTQKKSLFGVVVAATAGYIGGLMLARKPGKKFRDELKKSKHPGKKLFEEIWETKKEGYHEIKDWAENSEELKKLKEKGKAHIDMAMDKAKDVGEDALEEVKKHWESLAEHAKKKAEELKKEAKEKGSKFKNHIEKEVKTIAGKE